MREYLFYIQRFLSILKVKMVYWWWIVKYGGKKNIPPEIVFNKMEKTMQGFAHDIEQAFRLVDADAPQEEKDLARDAFAKAQELKEEIARLSEKL